MEDIPIPVPENLVLSMEELEQINSGVCPVCCGFGFPYKYINKEGKMRYFLRCKVGCILTETANTIEELNKKWDQSVTSLLLFKANAGKAYGQKKVHNGKGK